MPTVLIVDDSPTSRTAVRRALAASNAELGFVEVGDGLAGFSHMVTRDVDLVISDLEMPRAGAPKLLALRASNEIARRIPVLVLTAVHDQDAKVRLLELGASDYVTKPFHPRELVARANLHMRLRAQEVELRRLNKQLHDLARTDSLTGLANRREFDEAMAREVVRVTRHAMPLALLAMDLDHFKRVNDTYGHAAGDQVLREVAQILRSGTRVVDVVARLGGEELAVLMPHTVERDAAIVAERLREAIASHRFVLASGETIRCTASVGVAATTRELPLDGIALLHAADTALYAAKTDGRNRVKLASSTAT